MNIYPVQMNNCCACSPKFGARFVENEISNDLLRSSSAEDISEFRKACEALKKAKNDQYTYLLSGVTSAYGVCSQSEIDDKFVSLSCKQNASSTPKSIFMWLIRNESIVSGGYEKKNLLKEITNSLKNIAFENALRPAYDPEKIILRKANCLAKLAK